MLDASARLLSLLALLPTRKAWTGAELAARLGISDRTVRKDMDRLRELGYPIESVRGPGGHYRLGPGGTMPPLLLDDEEAVAVALGLGAATGIAGIEESRASALGKLEQVLPSRLRRRVLAVREALSTGPENTSSNVPDPRIDAATLSAIAAAIRDREEIRFSYRDDEPCLVEPYRLVSWQRRWYAVARDPRSGDWRSFRVDWLSLRTPGGRRFTAQPFPGDDYATFVLRDAAFSGWAVHARLTIDAPAAEVVARINPTVGVVETVDATSCVLVTGADSVETIAVYIGMLGLDFHVTEPPELVAHVATLSARYARALPDPT